MAPWCRSWAVQSGLHLLVLVKYTALTTVISAYNLVPCTREAQANFQFPDCYLPPQNPDLSIHSATFVLSHNAATGYIRSNALSKTGLSWWYSKNQVGSVYQQLSDGARALDLRPKYHFHNSTSNGHWSVVFHHGDIIIPIAFEILLTDVVRWCGENPEELVLLLPNHFNYNSDEERQALIQAMTAAYQEYSILYLHCSDVYGWTVGELVEAATATSGFALVALDGQDGVTSCIKENYQSSQLVTCYDPSNNVSCRAANGMNDPPFVQLQGYMLESANNEPSDYYSVLGPSYDKSLYPFWEIQALWQVDNHAISQGMRRVSSILQDNRQSRVNEHVVDLIYHGAFDQVSLVALDQVALHGNAVLSVLRNTCGQSSLSSTSCGTLLSKPELSYWHLTFNQLVYTLLGLYFVVVIGVSRWYSSPSSQSQEERPNLNRIPLLDTFRERLQESFLFHQLKFPSTKRSPQPTAEAELTAVVVKSRQETLLANSMSTPTITS